MFTDAEDSPSSCESFDRRVGVIREFQELCQHRVTRWNGLRQGRFLSIAPAKSIAVEPNITRNAKVIERHRAIHSARQLVNDTRQLPISRRIPAAHIEIILDYWRRVGVSSRLHAYANAFRRMHAMKIKKPTTAAAAPT